MKLISFHGFADYAASQRPDVIINPTDVSSVEKYDAGITVHSIIFMKTGKSYIVQGSVTCVTQQINDAATWKP